MPLTPRCWAIVPAAGVGARMATSEPKQYLPLVDGRCVLEITLHRLLASQRFEKILVAVSASDKHWHTLAISRDPRIETIAGGAERAESVCNGLEVLAARAAPLDWIAVHDAVRPCLRESDLEKLLAAIADHPVGGLLGVPVSDTLKRVEGAAVVATVDRKALWRAQTPQAFRAGILLPALQQALAAGNALTDDAAAIEAMGYQPLMVQGHGDNIKITHREDLALAATILRAQIEEAPPCA